MIEWGILLDWNGCIGMDVWHVAVMAEKAERPFFLLGMQGMVALDRMGFCMVLGTLCSVFVLFAQHPLRDVPNVNALSRN
jgi:hypothetical protein